MFVLSIIWGVNVVYKYQEISEQLRQKIINGEFTSGELLPDQNQLAKEFDTTRITIRKAIQSLIVEGIVFSKRGAGTFVRKDFQQSIDDITSKIERPLGTTHTHPNNKVSSKVLGLDARLPSEKEQRGLLITETDPVYVIDRVRFVDDQVFSLEHTIMPTSITKLSEEVLASSIYDHMKKQNLKIAGSHRIVTAAKATENDIKELGAKKYDPVLVINQISYLEDGTPFEYSESHFPYQTSHVTADINLV